MIGKRLVFALLLLLLTLPITGCWDRREMNELGIALGMGIDRIGDKFVVTVQVVKPGQVAAQKGAGGAEAPVVMYKAEGPTIFEAIRKMTKASPRKIYAAHLRVLLFGEAIARQGIGNALDLLSRDYELRTDFYLLVARDVTAEEALNILTPLEKIPANKLYRSIETSEKAWAPVVSITLDDFVNDVVSNGKNPIISGIHIVGNADSGEGSSSRNLNSIYPKVSLVNDGIAVFRKDRLVGWMNDRESKGYNYITNNVHSTVGHISCPSGGKLALEVVGARSKLSAKMVRGRPHLGVDVKVEETVGEVECRIDLTKPSTIEELERRAQDTLAGVLRHSIEKGQKKFKSDYFGFGNALHRSHPQMWKQVRKDWDERFEDADVDINVQVKIKRTGTITNSFMEGED